LTIFIHQTKLSGIIVFAFVVALPVNKDSQKFETVLSSRPVEILVGIFSSFISKTIKRS